MNRQSAAAPTRGPEQRHRWRGRGSYPVIAATPLIFLLSGFAVGPADRDRPGRNPQLAAPMGLGRSAGGPARWVAVAAFVVASSARAASGQGGQPPVVNAGEDQVVRLPGIAALDGTVTSDALVTVRWEVVSGPGPVEFRDATAQDTEITLAVAGTYVLRLNASDGVSAAGDDVTIVVGGSQPAPDRLGGRRSDDCDRRHRRAERQGLGRRAAAPPALDRLEPRGRAGDRDDARCRGHPHEREIRRGGHLRPAPHGDRRRRHGERRRHDHGHEGQRSPPRVGRARPVGDAARDDRALRHGQRRRRRGAAGAGPQLERREGARCRDVRVAVGRRDGRPLRGRRHLPVATHRLGRGAASTRRRRDRGRAATGRHRADGGLRVRRGRRDDDSRSLGPRT